MQARDEIPMFMRDWIAVLDRFLTAGNKKLLDNPGKISKVEADEKALTEYVKYRALPDTKMSDIERRYIDNLKEVQRKLNIK